MKITCPFCGIAGEIPDRPNPKQLRCNNCGTSFQPKPPGVDDSGAAISSEVDGCTEQMIDIDELVSNAPPDLGIRIDHEPRLCDEPPPYRHSGLGMMATILGSLGSVLLLMYFSFPNSEDDVQGNLVSIALIDDTRA